MTTNINASKDTLAGQVINLRRGVDLQVCHSRGRNPAVVFLQGGMGNRFNLPERCEKSEAQIAV